MVLGMPVRHPKRRDQVLLRAGYELDPQAIQRLKEIRLPDVWVQYPDLEFVGKYINPHILNGQTQIVSTVGDVFGKITNDAHARLDYPAYRNMIRDFIDRLIENPEAAVLLQELASTDEPLLRHSSNTCYLALLMGLTLEGYLIQQRKRLSPHMAKDVVSLGIGAMLHDIGMTRLPAEVQARWRKTHDEQDPEWQEHVEIGYSIVQGHIEPSAAASVLHHHQRYDGKGFPRRREHDGQERALAGERIHVFPRIIAAADLFDRLRHPAGEEETTRPVVQVLRLMQHPEIARRIDPIVYNALIAVAPPYPPGSLVRLSDGRQGVVISWSAEAPCRPAVQMIGEIDPRAASRCSEGRDPEVVDLRMRQDLQVSEAEGSKVERFNFEAPSPRAFAVDAYERVG
jgi:HD-GYP domain-containing protein (c-di-GMP phosphodiesterase class II)